MRFDQDSEFFFFAAGQSPPVTNLYDKCVKQTVDAFHYVH